MKWSAGILLLLSLSSPLFAEGRSESFVLGAGCFWCVEAVYEQLPGVLEVESGYAGGPEKIPPTARFPEAAPGMPRW